jgi:hypothetical protein
MSWDEEEDTTLPKVEISPNLQKVLTVIEKDTKLVAAIRANPPKALAPYNLTKLEIEKVLKVIKG